MNFDYAFLVRQGFNICHFLCFFPMDTQCYSVKVLTDLKLTLQHYMTSGNEEK